MESFFGGRRGNDINIVGTCKNKENAVTVLESFPIGSHVLCIGTTGIANEGEDPEINRYDINYGNLYKKDINGDVIFCGNIAGPQGPASAVRMSGYAIDIPTDAYTAKSWRPSSSDTVITIHIPSQTQPETLRGNGTDLMTITGMINWLNANLTYDKIVAIPELRGAMVSIGVGTGSAQNLESSVDANDEWPRRFFIFDYSTRGWKYVGHLGSVTTAWRFDNWGKDWYYQQQTDTDKEKSMDNMINNSIVYGVKTTSSDIAINNSSYIL